MTPGTIVICTDARLSEGRLVEGWRYVVERVNCNFEGPDKTNGVIPDNGCQITVIGVSPPWVGYWKSSRFRPLERKEIEDKVISMIVDKIIGRV